ncbi:allantoicase [Acinetobacter sp. HY1485]|uniref:allantoicase n=1 Tax=Acinetobacter sp. HY1485 TaxID=2970918 RepID=UPI0022B99B5D|nr:allantoicase [Acinetobacter sp. HY1485]
MATLHAPLFELPATFSTLTNLADARIGTVIVECSDEFFAPAERMLQHTSPIFIEDKFDDNGKWMDGWETRRKRIEGFDWCIIQLGVAGIIQGFDLDTTFFTGNYPASASIEGCYAPDNNLKDAVWESLLPNQCLSASTHHFFESHHQGLYSHIRLNIFPDGGIARLKVYGTVQPIVCSTPIDLVGLKQGGRVVAYSDAHYGHPSNLINPHTAANMGDGWETKRRRAPGFDWCILALGQKGKIEKIEIDTAHFKGNYPAKVSIQGTYVEAATDAQLIPQSMFWDYLLFEQPMQMDHLHQYIQDIQQHTLVSHIRINMIPDGGISRIRLWGTPV